jgi:hypothetical protein
MARADTRYIAAVDLHVGDLLYGFAIDRGMEIAYVSRVTGVVPPVLVSGGARLAMRLKGKQPTGQVVVTVRDGYVGDTETFDWDPDHRVEIIWPRSATPEDFKHLLVRGPIGGDSDPEHLR